MRDGPRFLFAVLAALVAGVMAAVTDRVASTGGMVAIGVLCAICAVAPWEKP